MRLAELGLAEVAARLAGPGLALDFGPARARVRAREASFTTALHQVYGQFPAEQEGGIFDVTASVERASGLRRVVRPQVNFVVDGEMPFDPFPADTHLPLFEWGLNWCLATRCNQFLLLHAGAVERRGRAVLLPAQPGSGKSTLTAALVASGFRLLSDEFGVVRPQDGAVLPLVRPVALKNESIDVIRRFAPTARMGPSFPRTRKGTVAHLAPDPVSIDQRRTPAQAALIVFPRYSAGQPVTLEPVPQARAFAKLAGNAFNYELLGPVAFDAAHHLVRTSRCYRLQYSDLSEAVATIDDLLCR